MRNVQGGRLCRLAAVVAVAALAATLFVSPALGVSGQMRTVYVLTSWTQQSPFTTAETEQVAAETDAFFRASSSGRFAMPGSVAGPIQLPRSVFNSCNPTALRNAAPQSLFEGFDRAVLIMPRLDTCRFGGWANPTEVLLNGFLSRSISAHELGHTLPSATRAAGRVAPDAARSTSTAIRSVSWATAAVTSTRTRRPRSNG